MAPERQPSTRRTLKPACDACHMRRVKCSHDQPCQHCSRLGLICEYKKATTAKKTAGKRIEALRLADKNKASQSPEKLDRSWSHNSPSSTTPVLGSASWPEGGRSSFGSGGWSGNSLGSASHLAHGTDDRRPYGDGHSAPSTSYSPQSTNIPRPQSSGAYTMHVPASPQSRMAFDNTRQVRFQSTGSSHRSSGQYEIPNSAVQPHSSFEQPQQQAPFDYTASGQSPHGLHHHHPGYPSSGSHYIPGTQFSRSGSAPQPYSVEVGSASGPYQTIPSSVSFALAGAEMPGMDALQSSVLPPFTTSMVDSFVDNQGMFNSDSFFSETSLPPLVPTANGQQTVLDMLGTCLPSSATPGSSTSGSAFDNHRGLFSGDSASNSNERPFLNNSTPTNASADSNADDAGLADDDNHPLSDSVLIPTLALFYERLGGVMPVFSRTWLFSRLDNDDHLKDPHFAAMLMAMSALTIMQAQPNTEGRERKANRMSGRRRRARAVKLLEEALKIRESPFMGHSVTLEQCCTSFFVFATLFGLGEHLAGWYRLRESITIAHLCRLHEPASYENLPKDEAERRLRMYWLLAITERAFAIQSRMPIVLTGNPRASTASLRARLGVRELSDFPDLQLKLFDVVDEKFVDCWNQKCQGATCRNFDRERAIALWRAFTDGINQPSTNTTGKERSPGHDERDDELNGSASSASSHQRLGSFGSSTRPVMATTPVQRSQIQKADVEVTRHWLLNRLWLITLNHGLLSLDAKEPPLRIDHAIHVAQSALDVCNDHLSLPSMEAHGVGFTYKLFDISQTLVLLCNDEAIADAISKRGHLEKQTTAAHTSGRPHDVGKHGFSSENTQIHGNSGAQQAAKGISSGGTGPNSVYHGPEGVTSLPPMYLTEIAHMGSMRGPGSLRQTVLSILNNYLTLFQKFRGGDHPYLEKLMDLIDELKKRSGGTLTSVDASASISTLPPIPPSTMRPLGTSPYASGGSNVNATNESQHHDHAETASTVSSSSRQLPSPSGGYGQAQTPSSIPPSSFGPPAFNGSGGIASNNGTGMRNSRHASSIGNLMSSGSGNVVGGSGVIGKPYRSPSLRNENTAL